MLQHPMKLFALTALVAALGVGPAAAGSACCACGNTCAPMVELAPPVAGPFYIAHQGPDYTGPGIVLVPGYVEVDTAPATYPYVGRDYYFPPYPYVRQHGGHHAKPARHHVHRHVSDRRAMHKRPRYNPKRPFDPNDK